MFKCVVCGLAGLLLVANGAVGAAEPASEEGFQTIFNGKDLSGWDGDPRLWSVRDGVIHGETTKEVPANGNTFLIWQDGTVADFELKLLFRCSTVNNSGVQYRSKHITDNARNKWVVRGYQHEIRNSNVLPNVSGFIYDEGGMTGKRGRIILVGQKGTWSGKKLELDDEPVVTAKEYKELFEVDAWNEVRIVARGRHIQHYMNGRLVLDFTDSPENAMEKGIVALQLHAGKPMWTEFKDIQVRHLK